MYTIKQSGNLQGCTILNDLVKSFQMYTSYSLSFVLLKAINLFFTVYTLLLMIRVIGSWIPDLWRYRFMQMIAAVVDPYLNLFKKIIPPIGGVLDISPILAFFVLQILQQGVMYFLFR